MQDRITLLHSKFHEVSLDKQRELNRNLKLQMKYGATETTDGEFESIGGEQQLLINKEIQNHMDNELKLLNKISVMSTEIEYLKQKVMMNSLTVERETMARQEMSDQQRINPNYRRLRYIGEPRPYDEILQWSSDLDRHSLYAKDRE